MLLGGCWLIALGLPLLVLFSMQSSVSGEYSSLRDQRMQLLERRRDLKLALDGVEGEDQLVQLQIGIAVLSARCRRIRETLEQFDQRCSGAVLDNR